MAKPDGTIKGSLLSRIRQVRFSIEELKLRIGLVLDQWELMAKDTKDYICEREPDFARAMDNWLVDRARKARQAKRNGKQTPFEKGVDDLIFRPAITKARREFTERFVLHDVTKK